jgi:aspartate carbamoyltransferase catalytic subunit
VGDLKNGRTVHSLATLIARNFPGVKLRLVAPPQLGLPQYVKDAISESSASICEHEDLDPVVSTSDVIYMTRVQKERFSDLEEYQRFKLNYVVTPDTMAKAKDDMVLMHPLPRVGEIDPAVDSDFRSAFFRQMENGMYVRMALLALVMGAQGLPLNASKPIIEELVA